MTSNILSKLLPPTDSPSIYETLREYDRASDSSDIEERAGLIYDVSKPPRSPAALGMVPSESLGSPSTRPFGRINPLQRKGRRSSQRQRSNARAPEPDEADDDVPASLLIETDDDGNPLPGPLPPRPTNGPDPFSPGRPPLRLEGEQGPRAKWQATQQQQRLHSHSDRSTGTPKLAAGLIMNPREKALWRWTNVENLDNFLKDVYDYYVGKGIWSITMNRILNLL